MRTTLAIVGLAIVLRLAAVLWLSDTVPYSDAMYYDIAAQRMAADWKFPFDRSQVEYYGKLGWWPPLYPAFVATLYRLFGVHYRVVVFVQVLLGGLVVWLVERLGRRAGGPLVGTTAALVVALDPTYIFLTNILASENLFVVWLALGLRFAGRTRGVHAGPARLDLVLAGVSFGLAALTRAIGVMVPVVVALASRGGLPPRRWLARSAWLVGASALVIAPWTVRNAVVAGSPAIVCFGGGLNFYFGHNETGMGYQDFKQTPMAGLTTQAAIDREGYRLGFDYLRRHPIRFFTRGARKVGALFGSPAYAPHANTAILFPEGWRTDPEKARQAEVLRTRQHAKNVWLDGIFTKLAILHTVLLTAGALLACSRWKRLAPELRVMAWLCGYWIAAHVVFWAQPRFRYPIEIPMALLAAAFVAPLLRRPAAEPSRRQRARHGVARAAAIGIAACVLAGCAGTAPPPPPVEAWGDPDRPYDDPIEVAATNALGPRPSEYERRNPAPIRLADFYFLPESERHLRLGIAATLETQAEMLRRSRGIDSIPFYVEGVRIAPSFARGWVQAARIAFESGATQRAHAFAAQGLRLDFQDANVWVLLGAIYLREEDEGRARVAWEEALALDPDKAAGAAQALAVLYMRAGEYARADSLARKSSSRVTASLHAYLEGVRARESGDLEAARLAFREAARDSLAPSAMLVDLGNAEAAAGAPDRAAAAYERALRREPGLPAALLGLGGAQRADGNLDAAVETFTHLVEANPRHAAAQFDLGGTALEAAQRAGRSPRADSLFEIAERAFAASAALGFRSGESKLRNAEARLLGGDADGAYRQAQALIGDPEQRSAARVLAARAAIQAERPNDVVVVLAPAFRADSLSADGLDLLGNSYLQLELPAYAVPVLRRAHERRPSDWKTTVNLGIALSESGNLAEAESLLRPLAIERPDEPLVLQNLAAVLQRRGKRSEAETLLAHLEALRGR